MMRYPSVLLFGAPGSGKGTQGKSLGALPRFHHFACGDVFRALDPNSRIGREFARYATMGALVPDELTIELWLEAVKARIDAGKYHPQTQILLLDGIPRTVEQARLLDPYIEVLAIVYLICNSVEEIIARILRRSAQGAARPDDTNEEVIRHRLDVYEEVTRPVLALYPRARVYRINTLRTPEEVTADLLVALAPLK
jgi:adenylate kinase